MGGPAYEDPHDEAHVRAFEDDLRLQLGELELHRRLPLAHMDNLDLAAYDRPYAPEPERAAAREAHLKLWPEAIDMAIESLDAVPAPVATALLPAVQGLAAGMTGEGATQSAARAAHTRLVAHIEHCAATGDPSVALGAEALTKLMSIPEATTVDLDDLRARAEAERERLTAIVDDACRRVDPDASTVTWSIGSCAIIRPPTAVLDEARVLTEEVLQWSREPSSRRTWTVSAWWRSRRSHAGGRSQ